MANINVNGRSYFVEDAPDTPLLWVLRESLQLTGTKFGCGGGFCGCCTVHINGEAMRSCRMRLGDVEDAIITTIEGLDPNSNHPVQRAWLQEQVVQCGYCQSGQIMQASALLADNDDPTDDDIEIAMRGNLCRCMTYVRIKKAIKTAVQIKQSEA
jgi:isoquinoline 1-oxidoreductase subunit alpha|tara:strand:+ start:170 stop:634 length:465 start_codon:yes stop_codon:yes gene_type:complete